MAHLRCQLHGFWPGLKVLLCSNCKSLKCQLCAASNHICLLPMAVRRQRFHSTASLSYVHSHLTTSTCQHPAQNSVLQESMGVDLPRHGHHTSVNAAHTYLTLAFSATLQVSALLTSTWPYLTAPTSDARRSSWHNNNGALLFSHWIYLLK